MGVILGSGAYTYRVEEHWLAAREHGARRLRRGRRRPADRVYLFNRGPDPMIVVDAEGNFLDSWGRGHFGPARSAYRPGRLHLLHRRWRPHDAQMHARGEGAHDPRHPGQAVALHERRALPPLHAHRTFAGDGPLRLGRLRQRQGPQVLARGEPLLSWGEPGIDPGQFNLPHNICCDEAGWVYVADREIHRIQIFDGNGRYETQLNNFHRPSALLVTRAPARSAISARSGRSCR